VGSPEDKLGTRPQGGESGGQYRTRNFEQQKFLEAEMHFFTSIFCGSIFCGSAVYILDQVIAGRLFSVSISILLPAVHCLLPADLTFPLLPASFSAINAWFEEDNYGSGHN
jgi:hypothetical protein